MNIFFFTVFFFFIFAQPVLAQDVNINESGVIYSPGYSPGWCIKSQEYLVDDSLYVCKSAVHIVVPPPSSSNTFSPYEYTRRQCWAYAFGSPNSVYSNVPANAGVLVGQTHAVYINALPANFNASVPCVLKSEADPDSTCNLPINVQGIVQGAFSNKFPMDLFTNFVVDAPSFSCPSFTIDGQTFQLCYINQLVAVLKNVLLVVFIISSVMAL